MINKKVTAILITILAISGVSANRKKCHNKYGKRISCHDKGVVRRTGEVVGDTAKGAGETAADILTLGGYSRSRAKEKRDIEEEEMDEDYEDYEDYEDEEVID